MKKTVTATLCLALMISSVSVGAAEKCNIKSFKDYISDKQISIKTDKCFNLGEFIFENNLFSCIFGENKFPSFGTGNTDKPSEETTPDADTPSEDVIPDTDKPSVEVKPETDKPSVEIKPETDKPSVEVKPETDKPSVEIKPETDKPSVEVKPETDKPSVEVKPETDKPSVDTNESSLAQQVLRLVNEYRAQNGKKALVLDEKLNSVALAHSTDMKNNNYFSHTNLKGQSPFDRLKNAGISYTTAGENIAMGQKTAESVVSSWINSEGHRKNLLNDSFGKMGLGAVSKGSGYYWTQIFTN